MLDLRAMGELIKERRMELRITQKELSEITNIAQGYISGIENGNADNITLKKLVKIARTLDVELTELFSSAENSKEIYVTNKEVNFLEKYRLLSNEQKVKLEGIVEGMIMAEEEEEDKKGA